ncbi:DUF2800 domain-containing protein [Anaerobacillus sp. HL2]|nr:DUF2800 domain-containing protein [Anaerobacillus sp. HL2]
MKTIKLAIIQPRLDSISEFELNVEELLAWGEETQTNCTKGFQRRGRVCTRSIVSFAEQKHSAELRADQYTALGRFQRYEATAYQR